MKSFDCVRITEEARVRYGFMKMKERAAFEAGATYERDRADKHEYDYKQRISQDQSTIERLFNEGRNLLLDKNKLEDEVRVLKVKLYQSEVTVETYKKANNGLQDHIYSVQNQLEKVRKQLIDTENQMQLAKDELQFEKAWQKHQKELAKKDPIEDIKKVWDNISAKAVLEIPKAVKAAAELLPNHLVVNLGGKTTYFKKFSSPTKIEFKEITMDEFPVGSILRTKDGRWIGNATVIGHEDARGGRYNLIRTDYGNELKMTDSEVKEYFHPLDKKSWPVPYEVIPFKDPGYIIPTSKLNQI